MFAIISGCRIVLLVFEALACLVVCSRSQLWEKPGDADTRGSTLSAVSDLFQCNVIFFFLKCCTF